MSQSNEPFKNFVNNHKFTFVASLASILGLFLALTIFFPPQKRPFYSVKSFNLINNSSSTIENLDIKYKLCNNNQENQECELKAIESLTITKILFWNGGRKKINKTDIDDNPITIVASGDNSILEAKIIHSSNNKTDFRFNSENNTINFNFLDSSNGGVIQVIHTGLSDEDVVLDAYVEESKFNGKIKRTKLKVTSLNVVDFTFLLFFSGLIIFNVYIDLQVQRSPFNLPSFFIVSFCLFMIASVIYPAYSPKFLLRYPSYSYEVFNSEITK